MNNGFANEQTLQTTHTILRLGSDKLVGSIIRLIAGMAVVAILSGYSANIQAEPLLTVERFVWTNAVDPDKRQFDRIAMPPIRANKAYLWMQLKGSKQLLDKLIESPEQSLPVRHLWYRYTSANVRADGAVDFDVGRRDDLRKLAYEVDANGFFRWRIWSGKERLSKGWWRVDLVYRDDESPVLCAAADGGEQPCRFEVEVR